MRPLRCTPGRVQSRMHVIAEVVKTHTSELIPGACAVPATPAMARKRTTPVSLSAGRRSVADVSARVRGGTQVFYPSEEEFKDFYSYMQKLDRLVGHVGVCKVVPPKGWQARPHDLYNLQDSTKELEESIQVKRPIKQNAIGGKGLYANVHEVKRSMKLADFKKAATSKEFSPPVDAQFRDITDEDVDVLERRFWRNVLFNPPMYGADCPAPFGLRSDGGEGLFDPMTCGDWDLAKVPLRGVCAWLIATTDTPYRIRCLRIHS